MCLKKTEFPLILRFPIPVLPVRAPGRLQLDLLAILDVIYEGLIDKQFVTWSFYQAILFYQAGRPDGLSILKFYLSGSNFTSLGHQACAIFRRLECG